jgi:hypothetical protein
MTTSAARLKQMLQQVTAALGGRGVRFALAGGMAMAAHGHPRTTKDLDFLIAQADAEGADEAMRALGFLPASEAQGFVRYVRHPLASLPELTEWADLLFASRPVGLRILAQAQANPIQWEGTSLPVVAPAGMILMKLLAHAQDPARLNDLTDMAALLDDCRDRTELERLREDAAGLGADVLALFDRLARESAHRQIEEPAGVYARRGI